MNLTNGIDMESYNSKDKSFTAPKNGYIYLYSGYTTNSRALGYMLDNDSSIMIEVSSLSGYANVLIVPIIKGQKFYLPNKMNDSIVKYYESLPLQ